MLIPNKSKNKVFTPFWFKNTIETSRDLEQIYIIKTHLTNYVLFPLKSLEHLQCSDGFRGDISYLIPLNSSNIRSEIGDDP